jgi:hypothetical protein
MLPPGIEGNGRFHPFVGNSELITICPFGGMWHLHLALNHLRATIEQVVLDREFQERELILRTIFDPDVDIPIEMTSEFAEWHIYRLQVVNVIMSITVYEILGITPDRAL